jgi:polar amino acid transport system substrate-binding protein
MSNTSKRTALALLFIGLLLPPSLLAQQQGAPLLVAAAPCPPFVISENGELSGLAIFLWDRVAREMGVEYQLIERPLNEVLEAISDEKRVANRANVGISCLSITAEREKYIDFSHSFYETYIGIAVRERGIMDAIRGVMANPAVYKGLLIFLGFAILVGAVFFIIEHRLNSKLYSMESQGGKLLEALLVGVIFISRGPINFWEFKTLTARVLATLLAIGSTFLIAGITAVLASAFTLDSLRSQVSGLQDLSNVRVGALESSTSSLFLRKNGIPHQTNPDLEALVAELDDDRLDAIVSDAAFLKYTLKLGKEAGKYQYLEVLPYEFESQNYGFALEQDSEFVESVNQALLTVRTTDEWRVKVLEYLGE